MNSGLFHCISCRRCPATYIGETGCSLRERFGEHLRSITKSAPGSVAKHFSSNGHTAADALVRDGNRGRGKKFVSSFDSGHASRAASMPIFTSFEVLARAGAKHNFQILNSIPGIVAQLITNVVNIPLMKGIVPKRLDICY